MIVTSIHNNGICTDFKKYFLLKAGNLCNFVSRKVLYQLMKLRQNVVFMSTLRVMR
jgi:hypothetical protein